MSEVMASEEKMRGDHRGHRRRHVLDEGRRACLSSVASSVDAAAHLHARQRPGACGLRLDGPQGREAFVTRGVKLIPMFTGLLALAALLALLAVAWWREGK